MSRSHCKHLISLTSVIWSTYKNSNSLDWKHHPTVKQTGTGDMGLPQSVMEEHFRKIAKFIAWKIIAARLIVCRSTAQAYLNGKSSEYNIKYIF